MLIGTLLSPFMFDAISYYGCYGTSIVLSGLMAAYFMFFVKECPKPENICEQCNKPLKDCSEKCQMYVYRNQEKNKTRPQPYKPNGSINYDTTSEYSNDDYVDQSCCNSLQSCLHNLANNYICIQIYDLFLLPCWSMWKVLFKRRSGNLQFIVILIMSIYALYWFAVEEMMMQYNYLLEAFPGFDGDLYSIFTSVNYTCSKLKFISIILELILEVF